MNRLSSDVSEIVIKSLDSETWPDFEALMLSDSQCSECWCLNHREPAGCATGALAKEKMKSLTGIRKTHGLLAYQNKICVGWIAVDPIDALVGHNMHATGKLGEWSIHCLFIRDGFRGKGLSKQLIEAAVGYAKSKGASVVSAFPIPQSNRDRYPTGEAEFSGRFSTFQKLGFETDGTSNDFYQRMECK